MTKCTPENADLSCFSHILPGVIRSSEISYQHQTSNTTTMTPIAKVSSKISGLRIFGIKRKYLLFAQSYGSGAGLSGGGGAREGKGSGGHKDSGSWGACPL